VRLAILAPTAGPAFRGEAAQGQGGAERQLAALGQALAARGHEIDVILAHGEDAGDAGGCRLWPVFPRGGLPLAKLIHPKGSALLGFLRRRGSEVLLQRGAADLTGLAWLATRPAGIGFVHALASDSDLVAGQELLPHPQDRVLHRLGLAGAEQVVVQTRAQGRALRRMIGRQGLLVRSFPETAPPSAPDAPAGAAVLWGGNLRPVKRPEWLISLAASLPQQEFIVFGGPARGYETYAQGIVAGLRALPNVEYLGALPPAALPAVYARCRILLSTSVHEGFSNTMLAAWQHGLDVVATVDPDDLLSGSALGLTARSLSGLRDRLCESLQAAPGMLAARRQRAQDYLRAQHDPAALAASWESILLNISKMRDRSQRGPGPGSIGGRPLHW
jgi:glycosyltransferase involved in cell wall biosynthesis